MFAHIAIEKWHWTPSQFEDFFAAEDNVKAFYYASLKFKAEAEEKAAKEMKRKSKGR